MNVRHALRKEKTDPEGDSEMTRTASTVLGAVQSLGDRAAPSLGACCHLAEPWGTDYQPQGVWRWDHGSRRWNCHPSGSEHWTKEDYSRALRLGGICLARFWIFLGPVTLYFFLISPVGWECLTYSCTIIVFRKCITCLVWQIHSWRGILPQDELYLQSHLCLI